jgi:hypothetical protein
VAKSFFSPSHIQDCLAPVIQKGSGTPVWFSGALAMLRQADKRLFAVVMASYSTSIVISRSLLAASGSQILKVYENVTGQKMTM